MKNVIKDFLIKKMCRAFDDSYNFINEQIKSYISKSRNKKRLKILDVGCDDGHITKILLSGIDPKRYQLYGLDCLESIPNNKIIYKKIDLENESFPFGKEKFDVIIASEVIEHLLNKDLLLSESYRVLKKKGLFICATENIASSDNIVSLLLGQEPLSQHTGSKYYTNSRLSPHFMNKVEYESGNKYLHKNVCSYHGLVRLAKINGFKKIKIHSIGNITRGFEKIFKIHNRLIIIYQIK